MDNRLRKWETALLLALCVTLCHGVWLSARQTELSRNVVRLHVVAGSDDEAEQALKLEVRDAVLGYLAPLVEGAESAGDAEELITENLEGIRLAALSRARGREVSVALGRESYPTRQTGGYRLPAGEYSSLRVVIGEGGGKNWWGIIFPYLVSDTVEETREAVKILGEDGFALIAEDGLGTEYKLKILELFEAIRNWRIFK